MVPHDDSWAGLGLVHVIYMHVLVDYKCMPSLGPISFLYVHNLAKEIIIMDFDQPAHFLAE
jgi:hypothetical protein